MTRDELRHAEVDTPIGQLTVVASSDGLRAVRWASEPAPPASVPSDDDAVLTQAAGELTEYFAGDRQRFELPLDIVGTQFQLRAWAALASVPYGTTTTYGAMAARQGNPRQARAVGAANARNPVPIVLPCHRLIGADGSLTGFGGGLHVKRYLLDLEARHR
jgi:methylated-DNA-[protein]-cysteine S-methyltransferase